MVNHFLRMACEANGLPLVTVSTEAIGYLQTLPFPGNIRELKNLVERALLMKDPAASQLTAADFALLSKDIPSGKPMGTEPATLQGLLTLSAPVLIVNTVILEVSPLQNLSLNLNT